MKVNVADFANLSLLKLPAGLEHKLEAAVLVPSEEVPPDVVTMQCRVVLADAATGQRRIVSIVYPWEADSATGRVSILDALGAELFGASLGDIVECDGPDGPSRLRVEEILYQPEQSMRTNLVVRG
jgi:regulator of nucleoside diphosphate kinase